MLLQSFGVIRARLPECPRHHYAACFFPGIFGMAFFSKPLDGFASSCLFIKTISD
jgi:hypothetical protein